MHFKSVRWRYITIATDSYRKAIFKRSQKALQSVKLMHPSYATRSFHLHRMVNGLTSISNARKVEQIEERQGEEKDSL